MRFAKGTARRINNVGLEPASAGMVLERLQDAVPHLNFGAWRCRTEGKPEDELEDPRGRASWVDSSRRELELSIQFARRIFSCRVSQYNDTIAVHDHRFLSYLATEAAWTLSGGMARPISVADFGLESVAGELWELLGLGDFDPVSLLQFVRALSQETYENHRLSYGLILTSDRGGGVSLASAIDNKRVRRLTDGFSTAILLDREGRILDVLALNTSPNEGLARKRRPYWFANLAETARARGGVGIALTQNGDLLIAHDGKLLFTRRAGKWRKWNHAAILTRLKSLLAPPRPRERRRSVCSLLYHLALDLAFRRSGGLLVLLGSTNHLDKLLASKDDRLSSSRRREPEKSLDSAFAGRTIFSIDRRILADLASLDGAVVVDGDGRLLAYGAMTRASTAARQGARTRAAYGASKHGIAIKVSSDGDIQFFLNGKKNFEI